MSVGQKMLIQLSWKRYRQSHYQIHAKQWNFQWNNQNISWKFLIDINVNNKLVRKGDTIVGQIALKHRKQYVKILEEEKRKTKTETEPIFDIHINVDMPTTLSNNGQQSTEQSTEQATVIFTEPYAYDSTSNNDDPQLTESYDTTSNTLNISFPELLKHIKN